MTKKRFLICAIAIALLHIGLVLFFGTEKEGFHEDEYYTYWSVVSEDIEPKNFSWHSGDELKSRFYVKEGQQFSYDLVVRNQAEDVHPPLYYLALHTFMSLFVNSFYKWFGILLNLLFSLVTYVCILFVFHQIGKHTLHHRELLALIAGLVYAIAPSTISSVMLTRMYAMSTMWTALYTALFLLLIQNSQCSKRKFLLLLLGGAAICYSSFLTHYFALLVPFFLTVAYCLFTLFRRKAIIRMLIYGVSMLVAILLAVCTFPACLSHIFGGYRGKGAIQGLLTPSLESTVIFVGYMNDYIFAKLLMPCIIVFLFFSVTGIVIAVREKKPETNTYLYQMTAIGISCLLSFLILTKTALIVGEASCRYFYPVIALLHPFMAYTVASVVLQLKEKLVTQNILPQGKVKTDTILSILLCLILAIPSLCGYYKGNVSFLYEDDAEKKAFSEEYSEYPVIMVYGASNSYRSWYVDNQLWPFKNVFYVDYEYMQEIDDEQLSTADKIVVFMDAPAEALQKLVDDNPNLKGYTLVRHDSFHFIYLLE